MTRLQVRSSAGRNDSAAPGPRSGRRASQTRRSCPPWNPGTAKLTPAALEQRRSGAPYLSSRRVDQTDRLPPAAVVSKPPVENTVVSLPAGA